MREGDVGIIAHVEVVGVEEEDGVDPLEDISSVGVISDGRGDEGGDECQRLRYEIEGSDCRVVDRVELYVVAEVVYLVTQGR